MPLAVRPNVESRSPAAARAAPVLAINASTVTAATMPGRRIGNRTTRKKRGGGNGCLRERCLPAKISGSVSSLCFGFRLEEATHAARGRGKECLVTKLLLIASDRTLERHRLVDCENATNPVLVGVVALSSTNIWPAGQFMVPVEGSAQHTLTENFGGNHWNVVPSPNRDAYLAQEPVIVSALQISRAIERASSSSEPILNSRQLWRLPRDR
jgi:hypothetical protein